MKSRIRIAVSLLAFSVCACATKQSDPIVDQKAAESAAKFRREASRRVTRNQGKRAARKHHREEGFSIMRYDFPMIRTGFWPHDRIYRHFGIQEGAESFGTLAFYQGWNAKMDRLLLARYGNQYRRYRKWVMPRAGAKTDRVAAFLMQPPGGYDFPDSSDPGK